MSETSPDLVVEDLMKEFPAADGALQILTGSQPVIAARRRCCHYRAEWVGQEHVAVHRRRVGSTVIRKRDTGRHGPIHALDGGASPVSQSRDRLRLSGSPPCYRSAQC